MTLDDVKHWELTRKKAERLGLELHLSPDVQGIEIVNLCDKVSEDTFLTVGAVWGYLRGYEDALLNRRCGRVPRSLQ